MMEPISFDEATHTYRNSAGLVVPSVTTILKPLYDFSRIDKEVLEAKAKLGTWVHKASELIDQFALDWSSVPEACAPYLKGYEKWLDEMCPVITHSEMLVYSKQFGYAGTFDRIAIVNSKRYLIDLKTTAVISKAVGVQLAAYDRALKEYRGIEVQGRAALQLKPDGTYRFYTFEKPNDFSVFMACKTLWNFEQEK